MCGHNDQVEVAGPCGTGDLGCGVAGGEDSRRLGNGKFCCEEGIESLLTDGAVFFRDFGRGSEVQFEAVLTGEVDDVNQRDAGMKESGRSFDVGSHGNGGMRKVDGKEDVFDQGHVIPGILDSAGRLRGANSSSGDITTNTSA